MSLNTITQLRLPDGRVVAIVDWTDKPLYSSADFLTGYTSQEVNLFTYVPGDQVPGVAPAGTAITRRTSSEMDTNISTPGSMASTEEMLVYSVRPEYVQLTTPTQGIGDFTLAAPTSPGDPLPRAVTLANFQRKCELKLEISQKLYAQAPIAYFNTGFGVLASGTDRALAATGRIYGNAGLASQAAVRSFVVPQHIGGQEKYRVILANPSGSANDFAIDEAAVEAPDGNVVMQVRVYLDGLYKRPVSSAEGRKNMAQVWKVLLPDGGA